MLAQEHSIGRPINAARYAGHDDIVQLMRLSVALGAALCTAAEQGDVEKVAQLLKKGAPVNSRQLTGVR